MMQWFASYVVNPQGVPPGGRVGAGGPGDESPTLGAAPDQGPGRSLVSPAGQTELPDDVRVRLATIEARAAAKVAHLRESPHAPQLLDAARKARSVKARVTWLHRWGSAWAQPLAEVSACRRGCAHCCHLPVAITSAEAQVIGNAIGRAPAKLKDAPAVKDLATELGFAERHRGAERRVLGTPCPFLQRGECTVYEQRPFACRTHLSLDDDDLLCRLIEGVDVPVPYANATMVYGVFLAAQPNEQLADIRAFFPTRPVVRPVATDQRGADR